MENVVYMMPLVVEALQEYGVLPLINAVHIIVLAVIIKQIENGAHKTHNVYQEKVKHVVQQEMVLGAIQPRFAHQMTKYVAKTRLMASGAIRQILLFATMIMDRHAAYKTL